MQHRYLFYFAAVVMLGCEKAPDVLKGSRPAKTSEIPADLRTLLVGESIVRQDIVPGMQPLLRCAAGKAPLCTTAEINDARGKTTRTTCVCIVI